MNMEAMRAAGRHQRDLRARKEIARLQEVEQAGLKMRDFLEQFAARQAEDAADLKGSQFLMQMVENFDDARMSTGRMKGASN